MPFLKKSKKVRIPRKLKKQIPDGMYCYKVISRNKKTLGLNIKSCPMFFVNKLNNGDCKYLFQKNGQLNGELGIENDDLDFCLDDQCKSCNFKNKWDF